MEDMKLQSPWDEDFEKEEDGDDEISVQFLVYNHMMPWNKMNGWTR